MNIDEKSLQEFIDLYFLEYRVRLTSKQAQELAEKLILLVRTVYGNDLPVRKIDKVK